MSKNVVVIGMHRSGTSAVTNALRLLGFSLGREEDLTAPRPANPEGNWEHLGLTLRNEHILELHGGTWDRPPDLPEGWDRRPTARAIAPRLRTEFAQVYPSDGWLWKDPRNCLTLPLWLGAWDSTPVVVMVFRHPIAVAGSLQARNGLPQDQALTLWESYNRQGLRNVRRLPHLIVDYDRIFADSLGFVEALRERLTTLGGAPGKAAPEAAAAFKESLRRNRAGDRELTLLSDSQLALWRELHEAAFCAV